MDPRTVERNRVRVDAGRTLLVSMSPPIAYLPNSKIGVRQDLEGSFIFEFGAPYFLRRHRGRRAGNTAKQAKRRPRTWTEAMEALSRKTEKEKVAELEAMLADATLSGDVTGECICGCLLVKRKTCSK